MKIILLVFFLIKSVIASDPLFPSKINITLKGQTEILKLFRSKKDVSYEEVNDHFLFNDEDIHYIPLKGKIMLGHCDVIFSQTTMTDSILNPLEALEICLESGARCERNIFLAEYYCGIDRTNEFISGL